MAHGTHCHCMMCTIGKKIGMIHEEHHDDQHHASNEHGHENDGSQEACNHCGHAHKEDARCDCGCK